MCVCVCVCVCVTNGGEVEAAVVCVDDVASYLPLVPRPR